MKKFILRPLGFLLQLCLMVVLPFFLLIRGVNWLCSSYAWHYVPALAVMFGLVFLVLLIYIAMVYDWIIGPGKMSRRSIKVKSSLVLFLMLGFIGYTLFNLSGKNAKTETVRAEYKSLHPMLRLSVGTLVLIDPSVLVTDMSRGQHDYKQMGLASKKASLHYPQSTGWVHAMDLRTIGRPEWKNTLLKGYFWSMGFNTLRHVGTADHLHISLSVQGKVGI